MQNDIDRSKAFLGEVFRHKPAEHLICIWNFPGRKSFWARDHTELPTLSPEQSWYYGLGTRTQRPTNPAERGMSDGVEGVPGVWVDIDIKSSAHKKQRLPAGTADIKAALAELDLEPSFIVASGWGYHVYWLYSEYCLDPVLGAEVVETLQRYLRGIFKSHGWELDATHDLARVLRLPGSVNLKIAGDLRYCEVKTASEVRYTPAHILAHLAALEVAPEASVPVDRVPIVTIDFDELELSADKLLSLLDNSDEARASFENRAKGGTDSSPSGYDFSLAYHAAQGGWSDQEIAALLLAHRRRHGHDLKRKSYYERTITRIRALISERKAISESEIMADAEEDQGSPLDVLKALTGLAIQAVEQHGTEDSEFVLIIAVEGSERRVKLGSAVNFTTQNAWIPALMEGLGKAFVSYKYVKSKDWKMKVLPALAKLIELKETGDTDLGETIFDYLESAVDLVSGGVRDAAARADLIQDSKPFIDFDGIYIHGPSFQRYIHLTTGRKVSRNVMSRLLRDSGFKARVVEGSGRTSEDEVQRIQRRYFFKNSALKGDSEKQATSRDTTTL